MKTEAQLPIYTNHSIKITNHNQCHKNNTKYIIFTNIKDHCPANCSQCSVPLECQTCAFGYVVTSDKKCQQENSSILDQIKNTTVGTPLMATFPDGSYILMWYQNGDNAGVYFQLYSADNVKVGDPMKVTGNARRLLSQQSIIQNFYADIISIDYEFFVTWMDASSAATDVKLKKFSSDGTAQSQDILLGTHQNKDLQDIKIPCQIKKTPNNSLLIAYMAKTDNVSNEFSMFISSYDSLMNSLYCINQKLLKEPSYFQVHPFQDVNIVLVIQTSMSLSLDIFIQIMN